VLPHCVQNKSGEDVCRRYHFENPLLGNISKFFAIMEYRRSSSQHFCDYEYNDGSEQAAASKKIDKGVADGGKHVGQY
jgi:hypothetical protein